MADTIGMVSDPLRAGIRVEFYLYHSLPKMKRDPDPLPHGGDPNFWVRNFALTRSWSKENLIKLLAVFSYASADVRR